jgi:hypothetical protein
MDIKNLDNNKMKKIKAPSHSTTQTIHFFLHTLWGKHNIMNQSQFVVPMDVNLSIFHPKVLCKVLVELF